MTSNHESIDVEGSVPSAQSDGQESAPGQESNPPPGSSETPEETAILNQWHGLPSELALDEAPELQAIAHPAWRITTDEQAEWAFRRLAEAQSKAAQINAQAQAWIDRIKTWADRELVAPQDSEQFFTGHLEAWARERREADPKLKTIHLPSGFISSRTGRGSITVVDEEAAIAFIQAWCDEMERPVEDLLRLKVEIKKDALREVLNPAALKEGLALVSDGEAVPGIEVEKPRISFKVEVT